LTSTPLQSLHAHTVLSLLSFSTLRPLRDFILLPSPQMENLDALLAILYSSNLLLSLQGVQQPCEDPSVDSSFKFQNSKSSLLLCLSAQCLNAHLAEYLLQNIQQFCLLCTYAPAQCPLGRALRILSDSGSSSELTTEFFSMHHCAYAQCPLGRASQNSSENSVCNCVSPTQPCLQGVQQP
jgi:hypothetical protein